MAKFDTTAPWVITKLMEDFGLDVLRAGAIVGNLGHESGGFENLQEDKPTVPGSAGGFGWAQWTGPRRRAYEAYCKRNNFDPRSDRANYAYLYLELKGLEGTESNTIPRLKATKGSLRDLVVNFEQNFLRAGIKHYDSRIKWTERALKAYEAAIGKPPVEPPPLPPRPVPVATPLPAWVYGLGIAVFIAILVILYMVAQNQ
jgi:hypothetical protein